jgi:hypothetical protein
MYFVRDADLFAPIDPVTWHAASIWVPVDKSSPDALAFDKATCHCCAPLARGLEATNNVSGGRSVDGAGRVIVGHWTVPPGKSTWSSPLKLPAGFPAKGQKLHATWTHLHPFATEVRLSAHKPGCAPEIVARSSMPAPTDRSAKRRAAAEPRTATVPPPGPEDPPTIALEELSPRGMIPPGALSFNDITGPRLPIVKPGALDPATPATPVPSPLEVLSSGPLPLIRPIEPKPKSRAGLVVGLLAVMLLAGGGATAYVLMHRTAPPPPATAAAITTVVELPPPPAPPAPAPAATSAPVEPAPAPAPLESHVTRTTRKPVARPPVRPAAPAPAPKPKTELEKNPYAQ